MTLCKGERELWPPVGFFPIEFVTSEYERGTAPKDKGTSFMCVSSYHMSDWHVGESENTEFSLIERDDLKKEKQRQEIWSPVYEISFPLSPYLSNLK